MQRTNDLTCLQITAVPACIAEFEASPDSEGVGIVGLVSHAGLAVDRDVAAVATGVDFIVSAHSHTLMFPENLGECLNYTSGACECAAAYLRLTIRCAIALFSPCCIIALTFGLPYP